jgi:16S rRNA processing protein RimM
VSADELVPVGRVGRPHGLDGAFVVERPSDDEERFAVGSVLLADGEPVEIVVSRRVGGGRLAIRVDRTLERGTVLAVPRASLPEPGEDRYYAFELVGLAVVDAADRPIGRVESVLPGTANDNLELDSGLLVPMIDDAVLAVDIPGGRVVVDRDFLGLG